LHARFAPSGGRRVCMGVVLDRDVSRARLGPALDVQRELSPGRLVLGVGPTGDRSRGEAACGRTCDEGGAW
jgi:hypothetical protein